MSFDPSNHSLKIQESIGTLILKMGPLGHVRAHSFTLSQIPKSVYVTPKLHS